MPRRTDRWFHLAIAIFALTLTGLTMGTLMDGRQSLRLQKLMNSLTDPVSRGTNTGSSVPGNTSKDDVSLAPAYEPSANNLLVQVTKADESVPSSDVTDVQSLLDKYHIVDTVSHTLQMNIYDTVHIYVAQNASDYKRELKSLGVSTPDAQQYTQDTGGFAMGMDIAIPMYQNKTQADLANTLAHELTHVFLNYNEGDVPSWMNEGLAWYNGMKVQQQVEDPVSYRGYAIQSAESVLDATKAGKLLPLTADESKVLSGPYEIELQDWLATSYLIQHKGYQPFSQYFYLLKLGRPSDASFHQTFGTTPTEFNKEFTAFLKQAAAYNTDAGASITLNIPSTFHGYIRTLQHGTTVWRGLQLPSGLTHAVIEPSGNWTGVSGSQDETQDKGDADNTTLYMDLDTNETLKYHGKNVDYSGFAIDYHYGMYSFVDSWVTYKDGTTDYLEDPNLFGVQLQNLVEPAKGNPILPYLQLPK